MSKERKVTLICYIISAVALIGLAVWAIIGGIPFMQFGSLSHETVHIISDESINSIDIDWTSGRVTIDVHDGYDIILTEFSRRELRERDQLNYTVSNDKLTVNFSNGGRWRGMRTKRLEILVPDTFYRQINIETVSGRIVADNIAADNINLRTVSGRIEAQDIAADTINTHTTSGRHELSGKFNNINSNSVSGRIEIDTDNSPDSIEANTTSGRITVTVPRGTDTSRFNLNTVSGRITTQER